MVFYKQVLEFHCPSKFLWQTSGRQNHWSLLVTHLACDPLSLNANRPTSLSSLIVWSTILKEQHNIFGLENYYLEKMDAHQMVKLLKYAIFTTNLIIFVSFCFWTAFGRVLVNNLIWRNSLSLLCACHTWYSFLSLHFRPLIILSGFSKNISSKDFV